MILLYLSYYTLISGLYSGIFLCGSKALAIKVEKCSPFGVKRSAGFGVRIMLPMFGLMGLDYGWGFDDIPGNPDANGGQFHFSIGQQF